MCKDLLHGKEQKRGRWEQDATPRGSELHSVDREEPFPFFLFLVGS